MDIFNWLSRSKLPNPGQIKTFTTLLENDLGAKRIPKDTKVSPLLPGATAPMTNELVFRALIAPKC